MSRPYHALATMWASFSCAAVSLHKDLICADFSCPRSGRCLLKSFMRSFMRRPPSCRDKTYEDTGTSHHKSVCGQRTHSCIHENIQSIVFCLCAKMFQLKLLKQNFEEMVFCLCWTRRKYCTFYSIFQHNPMALLLTFNRLASLYFILFMLSYIFSYCYVITSVTVLCSFVEKSAMQIKSITSLVCR